MRFVKTLPQKVNSPGRAAGFKQEANSADARAKLAAEADKLRGKPGQWAIWRSGVEADRARFNSAAGQLKRGKYAAFRPVGHFETAIRTKGDKVNLYVRFVGGESR